MRQLRGCFNPFGDHIHLKVLAHVDYGADNDCVNRSNSLTLCGCRMNDRPVAFNMKLSHLVMLRRLWTTRLIRRASLPVHGMK
jgi:hypothetical protein